MLDNISQREKKIEQKLEELDDDIFKKVSRYIEKNLLKTEARIASTSSATMENSLVEQEREESWVEVLPMNW